MLNEDMLGLLLCGIVLLCFIGLVIYIVHCFPIQTFILFAIIILLLLSNEIKYLR